MSKYDGTQTLYRLNASQLDLFWVEKLMPKQILGGRVYIMGTAYFDMNGHFDADAMEKAYFEVLRRNDAFRVRVIQNRGRVRQFVQECSDFPAPERRTLKSGEELAPLIKKPEIPPISVQSEHLTEPVIYSCEDGCGGLILWQNHICTDGYSVSDIVYPQLCELYEAFRKGETPPEPKKLYSFETVLKNREKEKEKARRDFKWWWKYCNHHLLRYSVPVRRVRETTLKPTAFYEISDERYTKLKAFCAERSISDNSFLIAVLSLVVSAETRSRRFSCNMQYHGRDTFVKKKTAGPILLTLDPMFEPKESDTLDSYTRQVHRDIMSTIVHARFSDLFKEFYFILLHYRTGFRDLRWLLVNNLCGYSTDAERPLILMGTEQVQYDEPVAFDILDLEGRPGFRIKLTINGYLAEQARVEQLLRKYGAALDTVLGHPEQTVGECLSATAACK